MKTELLRKFIKKYGRPESVTTYLNPKTEKKTYSFPKGRWVGHDSTGEMSWDGKRNEFNLIKENK